VPPLFRFELSKNPSIRRESGKVMHWFGLTDGRYWIDSGQAEIFGMADGTHLDYYVACLWEDLLEILPHVLEPLPASMRERLRDLPRWLEFRSRVWSWKEEDRDSKEKSEAASQLAALATHWFGDRCLRTLHLRNPPRVWFWREHDEIVLSWKTQPPRNDDDPVWSSSAGQVRVTLDRFVADFLSFHEALMKEMSALIARVVREHGTEATEADELRRDHQRREATVTTAAALLAQATKTDWAAVQEALTRLEAELG
jgi:hypothetical protein